MANISGSGNPNGKVVAFQNVTYTDLLTGGNYVQTARPSGSIWVSTATPTGTAIWGSITGTLSDQLDLQSALDAKQDLLTTGLTTQYFRGDLSLGVFSSDVLSTTLAGLDTSTATPITSSDTILSGLGNLQAQITAVGIGYVPYTGATADVDLGDQLIRAEAGFINSIYSNYLVLTGNTFITTTSSKFWTIPDVTGTFAFGTGSAGYVPVWTSANILGYDKLFVDTTNHRFGWNIFSGLSANVTIKGTGLTTGNNLVLLDSGGTVRFSVVDQGDVSGKTFNKAYILQNANNTILGNQFTGYLTTTATANILIGANAGAAITGGGNNVFIGYNSGQHNTGSDNTFVGQTTGTTNTTGQYLAAFGAGALFSNNTSSGSSAFGENALFYSTGSYNTSIGFQSGSGISSGAAGSYNLFGGYNAGASFSTSSYSTFLGESSGYDVTTGNYNTFVGANTGRGITTGLYNTILGAQVTGLSSSLSNNVILADGQGNIRLQFDSSGNATFPFNITTINNVTYSWPASQGGSNTYLKNDGSGNLSWATVAALSGGSAGYVPVWTGSTTLSYDNLFVDTTNHRLGWGIYSSLTANVTLKGVGLTTGHNLSLLDSGGTERFYVTDAGTASTISLLLNGNTFSTTSGSSTWTIPNASGTFAFGTGSAGYLSYWNGTNSVTYDSQLTWDSTNKVLKIIRNTSNGTAFVIDSGASNFTLFGMNSNGTNRFLMGVATASADIVTQSLAWDTVFRVNGTRILWTVNGGTSIAMSLGTTGNFSVGPTVSSSAKFLVQGAGLTTGVTLQTKNSGGTANVQFLDNGDVQFLMGKTYLPQYATGSYPSSPADGAMIYDTTAHAMYIYQNSAWVGLGSGVGTVTSVGVTGSDFTISGSPVTSSGNISLTIKKGNLTEATSSVLSISGTNAVLGTGGATIQVKQASDSQDGYISSTSFSKFDLPTSVFDSTHGASEGGTVVSVLNNFNYVNPLTGLVTMTLQLPSPLADGDVIIVKFGDSVATLSYTNGTVLSPITTIPAGYLLMLKWSAGGSVWL